MSARDRQEIVYIGELIVDEKIGLIEGCRLLVSLRDRFGLENDPDFLPFVGVVSETDDYPDENSRKTFSDGYLMRVDEEIARYTHEIRPAIVEACRCLISKYQENASAMAYSRAQSD